MSNQVFSNETEIYPILKTASYIKGSNIITEKYVSVNTLNPTYGQTLTIIDDTPAGTLEDPLLATFANINNYFYDDNAVVFPALAITTLITHDFGFIPEGDYNVDLYVQFAQGAVGADDVMTFDVNYTNSAGSGTIAIAKKRALTTLSTYTTELFWRLNFTVPVGGSATNIFRVNVDTSGSAANGTKQLGNITVTI